MRIALVSPFDPDPGPSLDGNGHVGGVERVFAEVSRGLAERGHDVTVVCSTDGPSEEVERHGVHTVRVRRTATFLRAPIAPLAPHLPPDADVVHVAATYPFTTPTVLRRAERMGVRSVLDFHFEPDPVSPLGRLAASMYRRIGPPTYRLADSVMVRSYAYGRSAPSLSGVPEDRWRIVPNGIDPERFHATSQEPGDHLLFVGRLVPYKGLEVLLHALALLADPPPLVVVGEGPLRPHLEQVARRLGVEVTFAGRVEDEDLPDMYRQARLTLLPSVGQQECFGITLLESMACGTPVVASAIPGVEDVARTGGLVARPEDPRDLAEKIQEALGDGLQRGHGLAKRIHDLYSWEAVTDRMVEVYEETAR